MKHLKENECFKLWPASTLELEFFSRLYSVHSTSIGDIRKLRFHSLCNAVKRFMLIKTRTLFSSGETLLMKHCNMWFIYIYMCNWQARLWLQDKWMNNYNWPCLHTDVTEYVHLARNPTRDCLVSQTWSQGIPLCYFEKKGFKFTASNWLSVVRCT